MAAHFALKYVEAMGPHADEVGIAESTGVAWASDIEMHEIRDLRRRAGEQQNAIGEIDGLLEVVRHDDRRRAGFLEDALQLALNTFPSEGARRILLISDGNDTESRMSRDQALEMAQKADVVVYAISTNITRDDSDGDKVLRYLTEETGGQAFFPFKIEDLDQSFENIANELRHQYNIFYRPEPLKADGLYHPVTVKTKGRKDLVVRARKGYYAPKL